MAKKVARRQSAIEAAMPKTSVQTAVQSAPSPVVDITTEVAEPKPWKMPQPCLGQAVVFYYRSTISRRNADVGFVTSAGEASIALAFRGQGYNEVFHRDDPRLDRNPDLRFDIDGVWEFTDEKRKIEESLADIEQRLQALERPQTY